ncbi:hypothetical protein ACRAWD_24285 [Caulobacter segnis]
MLARKYRPRTFEDPDRPWRGHGPHPGHTAFLDRPHHRSRLLCSPACGASARPRTARRLLARALEPRDRRRPRVSRSDLGPPRAAFTAARPLHLRAGHMDVLELDAASRT